MSLNIIYLNIQKYNLLSRYFIFDLMNKNEAYTFSDKVVLELIKEREAKGISRYRISILSGISQSSLKYIEDLTQKPTFAIMAMIADAIGVNIDEVIKKVRLENNKD